VWEVTYNVISQINASVNGRAAWISDNSNVVIANSGSSAVANVSGINAILPLTQTARITTTGATTYKVRFRADTGGTLRANVTDAVSSASSILQNKVVYTKIAGNLPSSGQTVDYVNVYRTSNISVPGLSAVVFNAILSGNIPYNTSNGQFTLTAGKTYKLAGNVNVDSANGGLFTAWYNVTSGAYISPGGRSTSADSVTGTFGSNQAELIFTPTVNTIVELRNTLGAPGTAAGGVIGAVAPAGIASQASIVQLGSTSNTVGTLPANDQSSAGYFDIGNMRMQWGTLLFGTSGTPITLPAAFANTNYTVVASSAAGVNIFVTTGTKTTSNFICTTLTNVGSPSSNNPISYYAIGQKP
jgi:hypothetical protein